MGTIAVPLVGIMAVGLPRVMGVAPELSEVPAPGSLVVGRMVGEADGRVACPSPKMSVVKRS